MISQQSEATLYNHLHIGFCVTLEATFFPFLYYLYSDIIFILTNISKKTLKGSITGILTFFGQNCASVPFFIYKIILEHQEKEINQILERGTNYDLF